MFKCENCGATFPEPKIEKERHGFSWGGYELLWFCPVCKDESVHEIECQGYEGGDEDDDDY